MPWIHLEVLLVLIQLRWPTHACWHFPIDTKGRNGSTLPPTTGRTANYIWLNCTISCHLLYFIPSGNFILMFIWISLCWRSFAPINQVLVCAIVHKHPFWLGFSISSTPPATGEFHRYYDLMTFSLTVQCISSQMDELIERARHTWVRAHPHTSRWIPQSSRSAGCSGRARGGALALPDPSECCRLSAAPSHWCSR